MITVLSIYSVLITLAFLFLLRIVFQFIQQEKKDEKDSKRSRSILDYRDTLLQKMRENNFKNSDMLKNLYHSPLFSLASEEYRIKTERAFELWEAITYTDIKESGKEIEEFYTDKVLEELLWQFKTPELLQHMASQSLMDKQESNYVH